jgi:peptidoglycan/xylan/chitin deacetylase (PgdA/CDA1 family)
MSKKLFNKKAVFFDETGKRDRAVKVVFIFSVAALILIICLSLVAIFGQPKGLLSKIKNDTNFNVIDKISIKSKESIIVAGSGTFIKIAPDYSPKGASYDIRRSGEANNKVVVLSFDDGPDPVYTREILSILKKEKVPGSFFLIGENVLKYPGIAREIVKDGQEIGNHTFSHASDGAVDYSDPKNTSKLDFEINFTQNIIISATGLKTKLFRAPYLGAEDKISMNSLALSTFALDKGYLVSSPTVDSQDWREPTVGGIVKNSTKETDGSSVLLFHDGGGVRQKTVAALPAVIDFYKARGYRFAKLSEIAGQNTMVTPNVFEDTSSNILILGYQFLKNVPRAVNPVFIFGLVYTLVYSSAMILLSLFEVRRNGNLKKGLRDSYLPAVTVLIPAYNEEKVIEKTIKSVLTSDYPKFKILVIDDGSIDNTFKIAKSFAADGRVRVLHKENGGKFSALNFGLI